MQGLTIEQLQAIYTELHDSGLFSRKCRLLEINGGAVNKSFQLVDFVDKERRYFVKVFSTEEAVNIDRAQQFSRQKALALLGLAATPCYLSEQQHFQVDSWVEGQSLFDAELHTSQKYQRLSQTLVRIHQVDNTSALNFTALDLPAKWQEYIELAEVKLSATEVKKMNKWCDLWYSTSATSCCVCHNDLSLQHVLVNPTGIIFDWEYAAFSNRYFDIASCLLINQTTIEWEERLLQNYAKNVGIALPIVFNQVEQMKPIVAFTNKLWFLAAGKSIKQING